MLAPTFWRQRRWAKAPTFDAKKMPIFLKSIDVLGAVSITPKMNLNGMPGGAGPPTWGGFGCQVRGKLVMPLFVAFRSRISGSH